MTTLIFFGTVIAILVFLIRIVIRMVRKESIISNLKVLLAIVIGYAFLWLVFYFISSYKVVPMGTDICFDDWCATIVKAENSMSLTYENKEIKPHGQFIILHIKMSNHARGIAQKPSEPRIHIIDDNGNYWGYSEEAQVFLEKINGKQIPIDERLELNQSLETQLVFDIPENTKDLLVLIEEGPFITKLLFNENKEVFSLK
jgi:hypothetical protein